MKTTIRRPVIKRCPYKDETDTGELVVTFPGAAPELHELGTLVDSLAAQPISHEDFTSQLWAMLPPGAAVVTTWHTGPWDVEVSHGGEAVAE